MRPRATIPAALAPLLLGGCSYQHYQSIFGAAAVEDRQFLSLFWFFLGVCGLMYVLVIAFLALGIARRGRAADANVVETGRHHRSDPAMRSTADRLDRPDRDRPRRPRHRELRHRPLDGQGGDEREARGHRHRQPVVVGHRLHGCRRVEDACAPRTSSICPSDVPTRIYLRSNDVIHSFWVPSLAGKQDLIPGRDNDITIVPKKIGIYRGQCAEFCGVEHAKMNLVVVVEPYPDFIKWWEHQLQPAPAPKTPLVLAGYNYVTTGPCSACHNIGGTPASGQVAPDLTHLASRKSLAAGSLPMSKGNLYGWVGDPQSLKPGNKMPTIGLEPDQLHAVVAYLETLK